MKIKTLILGSGPNVTDIRNHDVSGYDHIIAINNAWRITEAWTEIIFPFDFPDDRKPVTLTPDQSMITEQDFVSVQNDFGGFVYAGGTMAFTALYWSLGRHQPDEIHILGCDMVYKPTGDTHFYGTGTADPLRDDITLRDLSAKSARFMCLAAMNGCNVFNLSRDASTLVFPRLHHHVQQPKMSELVNRDHVQSITAQENELGYYVESGRYWDIKDQFDPNALERLDHAWAACGAELLAGCNAA